METSAMTLQGKQCAGGGGNFVALCGKGWSVTHTK